LIVGSKEAGMLKTCNNEASQDKVFRLRRVGVVLYK
jgi:hypothetical protein